MRLSFILRAVKSKTFYSYFITFDISVIGILSLDVKDDVVEMKNQKNRYKSLTNYLLWSFKERDFTLQGLKDKFERSRYEAINDVNKLEFC